MTDDSGYNRQTKYMTFNQTLLLIMVLQLIHNLFMRIF